MTNDARFCAKPIAPGDIIHEYLDYVGWDPQDLAAVVNIDPETLTAICAGKAPVTEAVAYALERVFRRPAQFWLDLQARWKDFAEGGKK